VASYWEGIIDFSTKTSSHTDFQRPVKLKLSWGTWNHEVHGIIWYLESFRPWGIGRIDTSCNAGVSGWSRGTCRSSCTRSWATWSSASGTTAHFSTDEPMAFRWHFQYFFAFIRFAGSWIIELFRKETNRFSRLRILQVYVCTWNQY
jgi:hypothetical protein